LVSERHIGPNQEPTWQPKNAKVGNQRGKGYQRVGAIILEFDGKRYLVEKIFNNIKFTKKYVYFYGTI
jgi:hypothetical protein